jgi:fructokinase
MQNRPGIECLNFNVVGIGEVLWDLLPTGPQLGGAPANFACHAHALGARAGLITRVGKDALGEAILQRFTQLGLSQATVQVDETAPTGTVAVTLSAQGTPHFDIGENVAWDRLESEQGCLEAVRGADAICFGSLAQRTQQSRTAVQTMVAVAREQAIRVFDVNLRQHYFSRELIDESLQLANVLKLNDSELPILADMFELAGSARDQILRLAQKFSLRLIALTRGAEGSLLYQKGQWSDRASIPTEVVDTVGAGDAFTAALVVGLLQKRDLDQINELAGEVARHVCSCAGATPPLPETIRTRLTQVADDLA